MKASLAKHCVRCLMLSWVSQSHLNQVLHQYDGFIHAFCNAFLCQVHHLLLGRIECYLRTMKLTRKNLQFSQSRWMLNLLWAKGHHINTSPSSKSELLPQASPIKLYLTTCLGHRTLPSHMLEDTFFVAAYQKTKTRNCEAHSSSVASAQHYWDRCCCQGIIRVYHQSEICKHCRTSPNLAIVFCVTPMML